MLYRLLTGLSMLANSRPWVQQDANRLCKALTALKLWKRLILAGCGDSRGNCRKGFMSSGAGMTGGLLRKAGTGPGRLTLPVEETQVEISLISTRIYDNDLAYRCTAQV